MLFLNNTNNLIYKYMAIIGQGRVGIRSIAAPPTTPTIWNNLVAYYTADNTANDAKGTYNGTLVNGTTYATGKINNGFSFDGVNDYVDLGFGYRRSKTEPFSYSFWTSTSSLSTLTVLSNSNNTLGSSIVSISFFLAVI